MRVIAPLGLFLLFGVEVAVSAESQIPSCRLDNSLKSLVKDTLSRSAETFKTLGKPLPFDAVKVNEPAQVNAKTLVAYVVVDANADALTLQGCAKGPVKNDAPLDGLSVRGGCVLVSVNGMEIRCSASAVKLFGNVGQREDRANPTLLYVLSHELGHLQQKLVGEYTGQADRLDLSRDIATKLKELQDSCDPTSTGKEEEADNVAVEVLKKRLPYAPYREPVYSDRGSLYWNIDQLALASDAWLKASLEREFISRPTVHKAFVPTEFPTPQHTVELNARKFVCEVLMRKDGSIYYPRKSTTHPSVEQRLRKVAEALEPVARGLPDNSDKRQFESVARLQTDLSPILAKIYRETGVYMEAVHASICTAVNASPLPRCK